MSVAISTKVMKEWQQELFNGEDEDLMVFGKWKDEEFDILADFLLEEQHSSMLMVPESDEASSGEEHSSRTSAKGADESIASFQDEDKSDDDNGSAHGSETQVPTKKMRIEVNRDGTSSTATATAKVTSTINESTTTSSRKLPSFVPIAPKATVTTMTSLTEEAVTKSAPFTGMRRLRQSAARETFLKAVAVATQESATAGSSSTTKSRNSSVGSLDNMSAAEQLAYRKMRNRQLAKETRQRKRNQLESLEQQFQALRSENAMLKSIVKAHISSDSAKEAVLAESNALDRTPQEVLDHVSKVASRGPFSVAGKGFSSVAVPGVLGRSRSVSDSSLSSTDPQDKENPVELAAAVAATMLSPSAVVPLELTRSSRVDATPRKMTTAHDAASVVSLEDTSSACSGSNSNAGAAKVMGTTSSSDGSIGQFTAETQFSIPNPLLLDVKSQDDRPSEVSSGPTAQKVRTLSLFGKPMVLSG